MPITRTNAGTSKSNEEKSFAISSCPRLVAHASGLAHSGSSGRLFGAPYYSRNSTISQLAEFGGPGW